MLFVEQVRNQFRNHFLTPSKLEAIKEELLRLSADGLLCTNLYELYEKINISYTWEKDLAKSFLLSEGFLILSRPVGLRFNNVSNIHWNLTSFQEAFNLYKGNIYCLNGNTDYRQFYKCFLKFENNICGLFFVYKKENYYTQEKFLVHNDDYRFSIYTKNITYKIFESTYANDLDDMKNMISIDDLSDLNTLEEKIEKIKALV